METSSSIYEELTLVYETQNFSTQIQMNDVKSNCDLKGAEF